MSDCTHQTTPPLCRRRVHGRPKGESGRPFDGRFDHCRIFGTQGKICASCEGCNSGNTYRGSFEAVIKVATGTANIGNDEPNSREREAARLTPSLYHLLPEIKGGLEIDNPNLPRSLFDTGLWQRGVIDSIAEYVRLHAVSKLTDSSRRNPCSPASCWMR